jgi:hypothetical protein
LNLNTHTGNNAKQDLFVIDAEIGLLSHPSTLECLYKQYFGASSERITVYKIQHASYKDIVKIITFILQKIDHTNNNPTGWTVRESNLGGGEIFRTRPDLP